MPEHGDEHDDEQDLATRDAIPTSSWPASLPIVRAWTSGSRGLRALLVVIALYAAWHVLIVVAPPVQRAAMAHMHLQPGSFAWWSVQHARPAMYNFANEYFLSPQLLTAENVDDTASPAREQAHHLWLNHYPFQVPLWWYRPQMGKPGRRFYLYLRSRFQSEEVVTRWVLQSSPARGERGLRFVEVDW